MSTAPFDIIAGPAAVFLAAVGATFPTIGVLSNTGTGTPPVGWSFLGRTDGGIRVNFNQTTKNLMVDQTILPQKVIRTEDLVEITFNLAELTLDNFAQVLNNVPVTTSGSTKSLVLSTGVDIAQFAMLVVGPSPYSNSMMQFELARVLQSGKPAVDFRRDAQSTLSTTWMALEDPNNLLTFGTLRAQTS